MSRGGTSRNLPKPKQGIPPYWTEVQGNDPIWETMREIETALHEKRAIVAGKNVSRGSAGERKVSFVVAMPVGNPNLYLYADFAVRVTLGPEATTQSVEIDDQGIVTEFSQEDIEEGHALLESIIRIAVQTYFQSLLESKV